MAAAHALMGHRSGHRRACASRFAQALDVADTEDSVSSRGIWVLPYPRREANIAIMTLQQGVTEWAIDSWLCSDDPVLILT